MRRCTMSELPMSKQDLKTLRVILLTFERPETRAAIIQLVDTFFPFFLICYFSFLTFSYSYIFSLLFAFLAGGLLFRISMIQHDCGHGSFLPSSIATRIIGHACAIFTLIPFSFWQRQHTLHHASANCLERCDGTFLAELMTVRQYRDRSPFFRSIYRMSRWPPIYFLILGPIMILPIVRITPRKSKISNSSSRDLLLNDIAICITAGSISYLIGPDRFLLIYLPILWSSGVLATWIDFVNHRFQGARWFCRAERTASAAALQGTCYLKLPNLLQWMTANVGVHHIHHSNPRIPNCRLAECHAIICKVHPLRELNLWDGVRAARSVLWDDKRKELVGFRGIAA